MNDSSINEMPGRNAAFGGRGKNGRRAFALAWLLAALAATFWTFADHLAAMGGDGASPALFFTSWSVWLSLACALAAVFFEMGAGGKGGSARADGRPAESSGGGSAKMPDALVLLNFCAAIMMIATFIVSAFVLPDKIWLPSYWKFASCSKHFILPLLTIAHEIFFRQKGRYKKAYPFLGAVIPIAYWAAVIARNLFARASFGGSIPAELWTRYYPYGFTNFDNGHSLKGLCLMLLGIGVGLVLFGFLFLLLDRISLHFSKNGVELKD